MRACGPRPLELQIALDTVFSGNTNVKRTWRVSPPLSFLRATQWPHAKTQWPGALSKIIFFFPVASTLQIAIDELDLRG